MLFEIVQPASSRSRARTGARAGAIRAKSRQTLNFLNFVPARTLSRGSTAVPPRHFSPEIFAPPGTKGRWPETTDSPLVTRSFSAPATRRKSDSFKRVKRTNFPHPKFTVLCRGIRAGTIPSVGPRGAGTRLRFTGAIPISLPEQPALWNTGMDRVCALSVPCPRDRQA